MRARYIRVGYMHERTRQVPEGMRTVDPLPWREASTGYRWPVNRMPVWDTYWCPRVEYDVPLEET